MKFINKCMDCGSDRYIQTRGMVYCAKCGSERVRLIEMDSPPACKDDVLKRTEPSQSSLDAVMRELLSTYKWLIANCVRYDAKTQRIVVDTDQIAKWRDMASDTTRMLYEMWNG